MKIRAADDPYRVPRPRRPVAIGGLIDPADDNVAAWVHVVATIGRLATECQRSNRRGVKYVMVPVAELVALLERERGRAEGALLWDIEDKVNGLRMEVAG